MNINVSIKRQKFKKGQKETFMVRDFSLYTCCLGVRSKSKGHSMLMEMWNEAISTRKWLGFWPPNRRVIELEKHLQNPREDFSYWDYFSYLSHYTLPILHKTPRKRMLSKRISSNWSKTQPVAPMAFPAIGT